MVKLIKTDNGYYTPYIDGVATPFRVYKNGDQALLECSSNHYTMEPKHFTKPDTLVAYIVGANNYINSRKKTL